MIEISKIIITQDDMNGDHFVIITNIANGPRDSDRVRFVTRFPWKTGVKWAEQMFPGVPVTVYNKEYD